MPALHGRPRLLVGLVLAAYAIAATLTIIHCDGTGDAGDSISHYLFARYAPRHPALFFDHWAKPLFVLLASPFAQFGFTGMKVFNALLMGVDLYLTYRIAQELELKQAVLVIVLLVCSPLVLILTFSGLTEPLFACTLSACILLALRGHDRWSLALLSFLPFIRSEGLIMIGVFVLFHLVKRHFRVLPFVLIGTVVYSIAGGFVHHDLLWTFTQIPYATLHSTYGSGHPLHFAVQFLYVLGVPVYILFGVGCIRILADLARGRLDLDRYALLLGTFAAFVMAHALFWYLGIFNSMGLGRVLLCVAPAAAIIAWRGLGALTEALEARHRMAGTILRVGIVAYVIVFPFTPNPAAIDRQHDLMRSTDQHLIDHLTTSLRRSYGTGRRFVGAHPYVCMALAVDRFDTLQWMDLDAAHLDRLSPNDVVIWDNWFAVVEGRVTLEELERRGLHVIGGTIAEERGHTMRYVVLGR